jgi:hypothetical protein
LTIVNVSGKKAVVRTKRFCFLRAGLPRKILRPPEYALSSSSTTTARFVDLTPCEYWPHSQQASEGQPEEVGFAVELFWKLALKVLEPIKQDNGVLHDDVMVYGAAMLL